MDFLKLMRFRLLMRYPLRSSRAPYLVQDGAFGIRDHIGGMALEER